MNVYEYTCTLFMNKLVFKQRKEDIKNLQKLFFFNFLKFKWKDFAQIFWKVKRKKKSQ